MASESLISLDAIGLSNHFIGLTWRELNAPGASKASETTKQLLNLQKKLGATSGVLVNSVDITGEAQRQVGLCKSVSGSAYSAAAVVAHALDESQPNALVIEHLGAEKYWVLFVIDKVPVPTINDCVVEGLEKVAELFETYQSLYEIWDLNLVYCMRKEIYHSIIDPDSTSLDDHRHIGYNELLEAVGPKLLRECKITELKSVNKSFFKKEHRNWAVVAAVVGLVIYWAQTQQSGDGVVSDFDVDAYVAAQAKLAPNNLMENKKAEDKERLSKIRQAAREEEAKWLFQTLSLSGANNDISMLVDFFGSMELDIEGWTPALSEYTVNQQLSKQKNNVNLAFTKSIITQWNNESSSTLNAFRNAINKDNNVLFRLDGENAFITTSVPHNMPDQTFTAKQADEWLRKSQDLRLDIISEMQTLRNAYGPEYFSWSMSGKNSTTRLSPIDMDGITGQSNESLPLILLTDYQLKIKLTGRGVAFNNLKDFGAVMTSYPTLMLTHLSIDYLREDIELQINFIEGGHTEDKASEKLEKS